MRKTFFAACFSTLFILSGVPLSAQTDSSAEIDRRLSIADSLRRKIKYSDAWTELAMISPQQAEMTPEQLAKFHKLTGVTQYSFGNYDKALESYTASEKILKTLTTEKSKVDLANLKTSFGIVYNKKEKYDLAESYFQKAIELGQKLPERDGLKVIKFAQNNLATTYELLGQYDNSVRTSKEVLRTISELKEETSIGSGVAHNSLGICYKRLGRNKLARQHYEQAAEIFKAILGPTSSYTQAALGNAASAIDDFGDAEEAIPILMRKLKLFLEDPGADKISLTNTYSSLGYIYKRIGDYDKSINAYEKSLGNIRSLGYTRKALEIRTLMSLASVEIAGGSMRQARIHLDEAFAIQKSYPEFSPADLIRLYDIDADYYLTNNQERDAYPSIKNAYLTSMRDSINLLNLVSTTSPRYIATLIKENRLDTAEYLINSTSSLIENYKDRIYSSDLLRSLANFDVLRVKIWMAKGLPEQAITNSLDKKLQNYSEELIERTATIPGKKNQRYNCTNCFNITDILKTLADLHLELYKQNNADNEEHLEQFLAIININQSYLLKIWDFENFSQLPTNEREHAKEIRQRIAAYDQMIFENRGISLSAQQRNSLYLDSILVLRPQLTSYIDKLETPPIDFNRTIDFDDLDEDQGLVLYYQSDDVLNILSISKDGFHLEVLENASDTRSSIETYVNFCKSASVGFSESLPTLNLGYQLFSSLLPEDIRNLSRLAIIESYPVENLPFAALPSQSISSDAMGFRDIHFSVEDYSFSYHQSPSSFFEAQSLKSSENKVKLSALAPSQVSSSPIASTSISDVNNIGLTYANQEVEALVEKFNGRLLTGQEADFYGFKSAFQNGNVVHIASHASSNLNSGEYSYIIITDTTAKSGERLYARTISELELPSDLVVLGACESGIGKLSNGEGAMSLSNVFLNAGSKSVLHTSWRVEDKHSQDIFLSFYDKLAESKPLDEALSQSQRDYLQTAGGQYLHPFYWAPFEISGKLTPLDASGNYLLYALAILAAIGIGFLIFRSR